MAGSQVVTPQNSGPNVTATDFDANGTNRRWKIVQSLNNTYSLRPIHYQAATLDKSNDNGGNVKIWRIFTNHGNQRFTIGDFTTGAFAPLLGEDDSFENIKKTNSDLALSVYPSPTSSTLTVVHNYNTNTNSNTNTNIRYTVHTLS